MANQSSMQYGGSDKNSLNSQIFGTKKLQKEQEKLLAELEKKKEAARKRGNAQELSELEARLDLERAEKEKLEKDLANFKAKKQEEINKNVKESWAKAMAEAGDKFASTAANGAVKALGTLKSALDETMNDFIDKQEAMAYGLTGTGKNLTEVTQTFTKALGSTGVVKQEAVYNKLASLINDGIIYNAEQRAYLGTLAEDLGMLFDPTAGTLTRLVNLQRQDVSAQRMAIEYSLKEFLNQNYQTSQYIKKGFQDVSDALIEAQSLMTATNAMNLEATVQKWLGSASSAGASSSFINALATSIGQLGSGDLSVLSSEMLPLLVMAANVSNQSFGELLNGGVSSTQANALLSGIASYGASIYSNSGSNVVLSELGKAFGISNVSDLKALSQLSTENIFGNTAVGTNINYLLGNMDSYLYSTTKINNTLANFMYQWATDVASSDSSYLGYKIADVISQATSAIFSGTTVSAKIFGSGVDLNLSEMIQAVPLVMTLGGLVSSIGGLGKAWSSAGSAQGIYDALAGAGLAANGSQRLVASGNFSGLSRTSGAGTSGVMAYYNSNTGDVANSVKTSALQEASAVYSQDEEEKTLNDVYALLETFKTTAFGTYTHIVESDNTVTIGNDMTLITDMITFGAMNIQNIYALLVEYLNPSGVKQQKTYDLSKVQWSSPFDWYSSASNINF